MKLKRPHRPHTPQHGRQPSLVTSSVIPLCPPRPHNGRSLIVPPWMVMATHGWWFPEKKEDPLFDTYSSNINMLIPMNNQGEDGLGAPIKHLLCTIKKKEA